MPAQPRISQWDQIKIAVAAAIVLSGFVLFHRTRQGADLFIIILGLIYLYLRWHRFKRDRHRARIKR